MTEVGGGGIIYDTGDAHLGASSGKKAYMFTETMKTAAFRDSSV
jgi:hypothetical protein